jgi:hypothetical protein
LVPEKELGLRRRGRGGSRRRSRRREEEGERSGVGRSELVWAQGCISFFLGITIAILS